MFVAIPAKNLKSALIEKNTLKIPKKPKLKPLARIHPFL